MLQPSGPDELKRPESVRVLLIEDERTCAQIVAQQLERLTGSAAQLVSIGSLRDALGELGRGAFDLIIADLNLPDSHGLATLSALAHASDRLIIVLTGDDDPALQKGALALGASALLPKRPRASGALQDALRL